MTKAERKAYAQQIAEDRRKEGEQERMNEHLNALRTLRSYLILNRPSDEPTAALISAIDDYAGHLTGDRTCLQMKNHSIVQGFKGR